MTTEQIDLATVKALIDSTKQLKNQLTLMNEQLNIVTAERDQLAQQVQEKDAQFLRDKEQEKTQHVAAMQTLKSETDRKIAELNTVGQDELQKTVKQYESQLADTVKKYEDKLQATTDELTKKNASLLNELQQTQKSHQAVINRIRGLAS